MPLWQSQIMCADQLEQLPQLIRLRLATARLQVERLGDCGVTKHAVASRPADVDETQCLRQPYSVAEPNIGPVPSLQSPEE